MKKREHTLLDDMIVEAGLGYWTTIGYKTGKKVQPYVRINDDAYNTPQN